MAKAKSKTAAIEVEDIWTTLPASNYSYTIPSTSLNSTWYTASGSTANNWTSVSTVAESGMHVKADATFDGNITWKGRNLGTLLESIEDRLAILTDPDPKKLEQFAALKKAYDNYKLLEKLVNSDYDPTQ